jgi:hypothetical protein
LFLLVVVVVVIVVVVVVVVVVLGPNSRFSLVGKLSAEGVASGEGRNDQELD